MYRLQDRETGTLIDEFETLDEAEKVLALCEKEDKAEGNYSEGFYEVVEVSE